MASSGGSVWPDMAATSKQHGGTGLYSAWPSASRREAAKDTEKATTAPLECAIRATAPHRYCATSRLTSAHGRARARRDCAARLAALLAAATIARMLAQRASPRAM